jgi:hypothetical protein
MRIGIEKTCLDSVLHLHVVSAQIYFRLYRLGTVAAATSYVAMSGLCSGGYFLAWNICVCVVKV